MTTRSWATCSYCSSSAQPLRYGFLDYPYKDGAGGFISFDKGSRRAIAFIDLGATVASDDDGLSIAAQLLTNERLSLHYNQAYYKVDELQDADRGASSLHAAYIFARNENLAFSIGLGGRYEHRPMADTTLSGIYHMEWLPVKPLRLSGTYEYNGESHFRVACGVVMNRVGFGIALRSEVIDEERYQQPEVFFSMQF
jgi:hypothetical protein